jgi:hypothetical protein
MTLFEIFEYERRGGIFLGLDTRCVNFSDGEGVENEWCFYCA